MEDWVALPKFNRFSLQRLLQVLDSPFLWDSKTTDRPDRFFDGERELLIQHIEAEHLQR
jgi:hypothetical protein